MLKEIFDYKLFNNFKSLIFEFASFKKFNRLRIYIVVRCVYHVKKHKQKTLKNEKLHREKFV